MNPILKTVLPRLGFGLLTLFVVSIIIFSAVTVLPGDFATAKLGQAATPETVAAFRRQLGLDLPPVLRYLNWVAGVLQGNFGDSFSSAGSLAGGHVRSVLSLIVPRLKNTLFLAGLTAIIAVRPARNSVFLSRGTISETTLLAWPPARLPALEKESPKLPCNTPATQLR